MKTPRDKVHEDRYWYWLSRSLVLVQFEPRSQALGNERLGNEASALQEGRDPTSAACQFLPDKFREYVNVQTKWIP